MHGAYIIAGILAAGTLGVAGFQVFAAGMSDVPNAPSNAGATLVVGFVIAALVAGSHFLPHITW